MSTLYLPYFLFYFHFIYFLTTRTRAHRRTSLRACAWLGGYGAARHHDDHLARDRRIADDSGDERGGHHPDDPERRR